MKEFARRRLFSALLITFCLPPSGLLRAATKEEILAKMEAAGRKVNNFCAQIFQKKWTAILKEFDRGESGMLWYLREKNGQAFLRKDIVKPINNILIIDKGEVIFYEPRIKQARKYQLGKNKDKAEFLVLGFGSTSSSMTEAYNIRLLGEEKVDGKKTYMLELRPKSEKVAAYFAQIILWVADQVWLPVQQRLVEPNGDYLLIQFSDLKLNPGISKDKLKLKLPKDVQLE